VAGGGELETFFSFSFLFVLLLFAHPLSVVGKKKKKKKRVVSCLQKLCERYKCKNSRSGGNRSGDFWNVFAVDLNNEPHGRAAWGTGCPLTDWRLGAERLGAAVLSVDPTLLIFCEGTSGNAAPEQCSEPCFWGGGLCSAVKAPVRLPVRRRLVLSPHVRVFFLSFPSSFSFSISFFFPRSRAKG
jgi:aryl-phospho-beta-D-glucosidase BglC (GH1 family)